MTVMTQRLHLEHIKKLIIRLTHYGRLTTAQRIEVSLGIGLVAELHAELLKEANDTKLTPGDPITFDDILQGNFEILYCRVHIDKLHPYRLEVRTVLDAPGAVLVGPGCDEL